jgi:hypothetical protein
MNLPWTVVGFVELPELVQTARYRFAVAEYAIVGSKSLKLLLLTRKAAPTRAPEALTR